MADSDTASIQVIELGADNTLTLPAEMAQVLGPGSRIVVMKQGDTLVLKRIDVLSHLDRVAATPDSAPLTLEEMNEIVHAVRHQYAEDE
ncbi:hypothetical protein HC928_09840 [bacterium]|nr:hypothetical protein [bacterium]